MAAKRKLTTSKPHAKGIKLSEVRKSEEVKAVRKQGLQHGCTMCEYRCSGKSKITQLACKRLRARVCSHVRRETALH